jgi:hypothetical protein
MRFESELQSRAVKILEKCPGVRVFSRQSSGDIRVTHEKLSSGTVMYLDREAVRAITKTERVLPEDIPRELLRTGDWPSILEDYVKFILRLKLEGII